MSRLTQPREEGDGAETPTLPSVGRRFRVFEDHAVGDAFFHLLTGKSPQHNVMPSQGCLEMNSRIVLVRFNSEFIVRCTGKLETASLFIECHQT